MTPPHAPSETGRDERIAQLMEPFHMLPKMTAHEARLQVWGADPDKWQWTTSDTIDSPLGWWEATIGTDHGSPRSDHLPVRWSLSYRREEMEAAMLVLDRLASPGFRVHITANGSGEFDLTWEVMGEGETVTWECLAEVTASTLADAIFEAALPPHPPQQEPEP